MQHFWEQLTQRITRSHLIRFGVSLLLAILLWGFVTDILDPASSRRFTELIIEEPDLSGTIEVVSALDRVTVTVSDVESRLESLDRTDVTVSLDVSEVDGAGTFQVPVEVTTEGFNYRDITVSPDTVSIQVEQEVSALHPLTIENQMTAGDVNRITDTTPAVSQVTVRGSQSAVERVDRVILPVSSEGQTTDFTMLFEPIAVSQDGQRVQEVTVEPGQIRTFVEVVTEGKTVSVVPQIQGIPAEGFIVQQTIALPSTVIIDGPQEALDSILFVDTQNVDIEGAMESISQTIELEALPDEVVLIEPASNQIEVRISVGTSAATPNLIQGMPVATRNLDENSQASVDPEVVDLSVSASSDILLSLTPDDIDVYVDVAGLGPGVYSIVPEVTLPPDVSAIVVEPETITVLITGNATPEASPSARMP
ncbi:MAG: CdaR family protein [Chloroflexota bacterium]|nr:CdaR family protein [Chloroflexota bacterium]